MQRVLLALLILVLGAAGVGLFVVLQPGGSESEQSAPASLSAPAPKPAPAPAREAALSPVAERATSKPVAEPASAQAKPIAAVEEQGGRVEAQEVATITGVVRMPEGTPADEALVVRARTTAPDGHREVFALISDEDEDDDEVLAEAELDASGTFELKVPLDHASVWLELEGRYLYLEHALSLALEPETTAELHPELGAYVTGKLLVPADATPEELEDAGVRIQLRPDPMRSMGAMGISRSSRTRRTTQADDDLTYEFRGVKPGPAFRVRVGPHLLTASKSEPVELVAGVHSRIDMVLTRGARMSGRVVDTAGNPVAEAEIELSQDHLMFGQGGFDVREGETDDQGNFDLRGILPGLSKVEVTADGFIQLQEEIELAEGQRVTGLTYTVDTGNHVAGIVTWPDGSPAVEMEVDLRFDLAYLGGMEAFNAMKGAEGEAETDAAGRFKITGLGKGPFTIIATGENDEDPVDSLTGDRPEWRARVDAVRPGTEVTLVMTPPIAIDGVVVNDLGEPLTEFRVLARVDTGGMLGGIGSESESADFEDEQGRFHLPGLREGEWTVSASAEHYGQPVPVKVQVPQAEGDLLQIVLPRAASVAGVVLDPSGKPIPGAGVGQKFELADLGRIGSEGREPPRATTDEFGKFQLSGLTPGPMSLVADAEEYADSEPVPVELVASEELEGVTLQLRIGGRILGEVLDDDGKPSTGRTVLAQVPTDPGNQRWATSDGKGEFVIEHVSPGTYQVMTFPVADAGGGGGVDDSNFAEFFSEMKLAMAEVTDGEDTHVTLGSKAGDPVTINGRVVAGGKGVGGVLVSFFVDGQQMMDGMKFANTSSDGSFEIKLGSPGRYLVNVQKITGTGTQQNVEFSRTIPEVERHDLVLDMPVSSISGTVYNPDRQPAPDTRISLSVDGPIRNGSFTGGNYAEITTDSEGNYELMWLRPGTYSVAAGGSSLMAMFGAGGTGPGRQVRSGLKVSANQQLTGIDFRLKEPGTLVGSVLDLTGKPVAKAAIFLRDGNGNSLDRFSLIETDAAGKFSYPGLEPGDYTVSARDKGRVSADAASARVRSGQETSVELTVDAGTILIVSLSDKDDNPVQCSVEVRDSEGRQVNGMWSMSELMAAFSQGGFSSLDQRVGPLPPGKYRVIATGADGLSANKPVTLRSGMDERKLNLRLD